MGKELPNDPFTSQASHYHVCRPGTSYRATVALVDGTLDYRTSYSTGAGYWQLRYKDRRRERSGLLPWAYLFQLATSQPHLEVKKTVEGKPTEISL